MKPLLLLVLLAGVAPLSAQHLKVTPHADGSHVPASIPYDGPADDGKRFVGFAGWEKNNIPGQVANGRAYWIIPRLKLGQQQDWIAGRRAFMARARKGFELRSSPDRHIEIWRHSKPVLRFLLDSQRLYLFDDPGHRPRHLLHFGWAKTKFQDETFDTWLREGASLTIGEVSDRGAGTILGTLTPHITWKTDKGTVFLNERRSITAYAQPNGILLDFDTTLKAPNGDVELGGDPARSGIQFRPFGGSKVQFQYAGEQIDPEQARDLPWVALSCTVPTRELHVQLICHSSLPRGTRLHVNPMNGHLGSSPRTTISSGQSLRLRYRLVLREGPAPARDELERNYQQFITPPTVEVVKR